MDHSSAKNPRFSHYLYGTNQSSQKMDSEMGESGNQYAQVIDNRSDQQVIEDANQKLPKMKIKEIQ